MSLRSLLSLGARDLSLMGCTNGGLACANHLSLSSCEKYLHTTLSLVHTSITQSHAHECAGHTEFVCYFPGSYYSACESSTTDTLNPAFAGKARRLIERLCVLFYPLQRRPLILGFFAIGRYSCKEYQ